MIEAMLCQKTERKEGNGAAYGTASVLTALLRNNGRKIFVFKTAHDSHCGPFIIVPEKIILSIEVASLIGKRRKKQTPEEILGEQNEPELIFHRTEVLGIEASRSKSFHPSDADLEAEGSVWPEKVVAFKIFVKEKDESNKLEKKNAYLIIEAPATEAPLPTISGEDDVSTSDSIDELAIIFQKMKESIIVKDRFYKMRRFTNCILGSEAVVFLSGDQYLEREETKE
ncbi:unnamed protein product [Dovyalis caffra]|uniref:Uncharacterized protein n=1 Tax=Dovyalis caffra TaxID=77055 RepID=A0AAV1SBS3_9ROSI|nr:unnamed protein product [Dovyalis caffra]